MPPVPIPPEIEDFLRKPNPAVVATIRSDGSPHSVATWYDLVDGRILLNLATTRARLAHIKRDPRVSLTLLDVDDWYTHVTLTGVIEQLVDDPELADIDRLALRYQGHRFRNREAARVSAWMRCERWYRWD
jgi:PPOX class probable F420-dependent enzyme